jgi:hypothetical protein
MSKCSKIREAWASGDRIGALRVAAGFFDRSEDTQIFKRGMDAHNHPDFYRQIGRDPNQLTAMALQLLAVKFRLGEAIKLRTGSSTQDKGRQPGGRERQTVAARSSAQIPGNTLPRG